MDEIEYGISNHGKVDRWTTYERASTYIEQYPESAFIVRRLIGSWERF